MESPLTKDLYNALFKEVNSLVGDIKSVSTFANRAEMTVSERAEGARAGLETEKQDALRHIEKITNYQTFVTGMVKSLSKYVPDLLRRSEIYDRAISLEKEVDDLGKISRHIIGYAEEASRGARYNLQGESDEGLEVLESMYRQLSSLAYNFKISAKALLKEVVPYALSSPRGRSEVEGFAKNEKELIEKIKIGSVVAVSVAGIGGFIWFMKSVQEPISSTAAIVSGPDFTFVQVLLSVLIFAGLIYGFKHLNK